MGPSSRRTTSISAAKLRSLRIMLLSRSRRQKTRNNFGTTTTTAPTVTANKLNNNNNCNTNQNAIATTNMKNQVKSEHKKFIVSKLCATRMRMDEEFINDALAADEDEEEEEDEEEAEAQAVQETAETAKILEPKLETLETTAAPATATANTTVQQATTTTTNQNQASEKVFYDNRIKRKNVLALNEKVAAIREYEKMPVYKRIGRMFQCSPDQIKRIVQQKETILKAWEQRTRRCQDAKTLEMKVVRVSMLGKAVYDWIRRMMYYKDFMITDGLIQKMALQFKSAMGLQNFFPHQDWCDKFRQTYKINEHDSKLLHIGYTQGHSVQIKDIIKDVLSECTPDLRTCETSAENELMQQPKVKTSKLLPKCMKQERKSEDVASVSATNSCNNTNTSGTLTNTKPTMRHLQLPQLVTLPRGLANMPQKILVATPITNATPATATPTSTPMTMTIIPLATITQPLSSANSLIAANTKRAGRIVPPPIVEVKREIKEERRDEDEEQPATPVLATKPAEPTITTTAATTTPTAAATPTTTTSATTTSLTIKEEIISDDEDAEEAARKAHILPNSSAQTNELTATTTTSQNLQQRTTTSVRSRENLKMCSPTAEGDDTMDSMDYENLALSSLKKIMQNKAAASEKITTTTTTTTTCTTNTTTTRPTVAKMSMRNTPTLTLTPIENLRATSVPLPPMVALSQLARVPITNNNDQLPPMPPLQLLPPLTKAPSKHLKHNTNSQQLQQQQQQQQPLPALIPRAYAATNVIQAAQLATVATGAACTPLYSMGYRLPQKRKLYDDSVPMSPIKSCSEARRYLKLLEDFALFRENYRLIGLITRADEVLRELDGDDDVDVD